MSVPVCVASSCNVPQTAGNVSRGHMTAELVSVGTEFETRSGNSQTSLA